MDRKVTFTLNLGDVETCTNPVICHSPGWQDQDRVASHASWWRRRACRPHLSG